MSYAKTISLNCDEVAVVLMALAERRIEAERLATKYRDMPSMCAYWHKAVIECDIIKARIAALTYEEEPQITDAELTALEEEERERLEEERERLEEERIAAEEDEYEEAARQTYEPDYEHEDWLEQDNRDFLKGCAE
jgi:hypothetical protein